MKVKFYNIADDEKLKFAVIIARSGGKWVFCRHKDRSTLEIPGGHREPGETIAQTAGRELREETGAEEFTLKRVCIYSVTGRNRVNSTGRESFGALYCAEITRFGCRFVNDFGHDKKKEIQREKANQEDASDDY